MNTNARIPQKGQPFQMNDEGWTITPTYVALSEAPRPNGACVTASTKQDGFCPAGWYVEDAARGYRGFVPGVEVLHDSSCDGCLAALHGAQVTAQVTGSVGSHVKHDHRDAATGQLVTDHAATYRRVPGGTV